jgi:hypothetical protein
MAKIEFLLEGGPYQGNHIDIPEEVLEAEDLPFYYGMHSRKNAYIYVLRDKSSRSFRFHESFPLDSTQQ